MIKFRFILLILFIVLAGAIFFREDILKLYSELSLNLPRIQKEISDSLINEIEKQISTPSPLISREEEPESFLTKTGVIRWTNLQREKNNLPPLEENSILSAMAEEKVKDMFENQYFAHDSPSGVGVGDLAKNFGYEFIAIGENLALGNYKDDEALLEAWMASPGHRENILNTQYQEIGIAVERGLFEGKYTWLAVQHFGLPLSACPQPSKNLKTSIVSSENQIEELQKTLELLLAEIKNTRPRRDPTYSQKVEEYNNLIEQYNDLIGQTKLLINDYNNQVKAFNDCVSSVGET